MRFGKLVRAARKERGVRQDDLAGRLGVTAAYLSEIETGRKSPSLDLTLRIGRSLHLNVDRLLLERLNDDMPPGYRVIKDQEKVS
jgi:transcriptional regulator with XRE-family HTH domain